jgi:hypothetical protein
VPSESTERVRLRWNATAVPYRAIHDPIDLSPASSAAAISESVAAWNAISPVPLLEGAQATNTIRYSGDLRYFGPGVVAVTALGYSPSSGAVTNGDILINQASGRGFCLGSSKSSTACIYLGDVITHELGHFLGLSHSEVAGSSMTFAAMRGHHTPHADDAAGVRAVYAARSWGRLRGTVRGGNQVPVFGAHVQAISTRTGQIASSALSSPDGTFAIEGLPTDDVYHLYIAPLARPISLPDAFRSVKNDFCPGDWVGSFFETCANGDRGRPQPLRLTSAAPDLQVGTVTIRCQPRMPAAYFAAKAADAGGELDFIATPSRPVRPFVGIYPRDTVLATDFASSVGLDDVITLDLSLLAVPAGSPQLELRVMTTSLGSPLDFSVEIDGPAGTQTDTDRVTSGGYGVPDTETGSLVPIYDRVLTYPLSATAALNRFTVTLKPRALRTDELAAIFPADDAFVSKDRLWLAWVRITDGGLPVTEDRTAVLADNRSCLDAPYTRPINANPVSGSAMSAADGGEAVEAAPAAAACGTWEPPSDGGGGGPFLLTLLCGLMLTAFKRPRRT